VKNTMFCEVNMSQLLTQPCPGSYEKPDNFDNRASLAV
jgi:hypothetical protein